MAMDPVVHFEMPAKDRQRMSEFYSKTFGWKTQQLGAEMGDYVLATTSKEDKTGRPAAPGTINGGFYQRTKKTEVPHVVIQVEDIEASIKKIKKGGGKVKGHPVEIPGIGLYVAFTDTEGNNVCILQPVMAKPKKAKK